ncbi:hypothetical protein [Rubinisphaera sp.]|uniref:hypothetical protein n=1 Tax=Rubinisphaera sp. TaxID=2024857 RepID=UPI000C109195|nr:hypothetical protein [Rubinisphaera sp.]MBV07614.1 hypothetical protein [Rubinisphaera sp.]HCS55481.1 hypothetical protein [Planctomycetaceae bacterium]|tara:strand:+ start:55 stop:960 length:906 start_codon:yes stop_codon:yes gene_type:complete
MDEPRIIFADGVVSTGRNVDARILSCRSGDEIVIGDTKLSAFKKIWGEWHQNNAYREIRLCLNIAGQQVLEGEKDSEPAFFEFARRIARRRKSLSADIGVLFFNFAAAHAHLRVLLYTYARLTSTIGPQIKFEHSPVISLQYPEAYAHFDACIFALRSFADSSRFIIWRALGRGKSIPRNLRTLVSANLPEELSQVIRNYLDMSINDLTEYRDNSIHYAPPGAHMSPTLLWSKGVIHAQVWLPYNPSARSLKKFRYRQKDAFAFARSLLEQSYDFCDELFPVLDELQRKQIREKRKTRKVE